MYQKIKNILKVFILSCLVVLINSSILNISATTKIQKVTNKLLKVYNTQGYYTGQLKNSIPNGQGTITYKNGDKYIGQWKNGKHEGKGTYMWKKGNKYQGQFKNNKFDGQGILTYKNGAKYTGQWRNGLMQGKGTMIYENGNKYEGQWSLNFQNGYGKLTDANGNVISEGQWLNGKYIEEEPEYIGNFSNYIENDNLNVYFSLYKNDQKSFIASDGVAKITIKNKNNTILYSKDFTVSKADFKTYTKSLTGQTFSACMLEIPINEIAKSTISEGTISLVFSTTKSTFKELQDSILELPVYSADELQAIEDKEFSNNAISLDIEKTIPNYMSIKVKKIGLMTIDNVKYMRIDIYIKNLGNSSIQCYLPKAHVLGSNSKQIDQADIYHYSYKNAFEGGDILPNGSKEGAIFFKINNISSLDFKELRLDTGLCNYDLLSKNIGAGDAILDDYKYIFNFNISNLILQNEKIISTGKITNDTSNPKINDIKNIYIGYKPHFTTNVQSGFFDTISKLLRYDILSSDSKQQLLDFYNEIDANSGVITDKAINIANIYLNSIQQNSELSYQYDSDKETIMKMENDQKKYLSGNLTYNTLSDDYVSFCVVLAKGYLLKTMSGK